MINMVKYFDQWSHLHDGNDTKFIICCLILIALIACICFIVVSSTLNIFAKLLLGFILSVALIFTTSDMIKLGIVDKSKENQLIHEARTEIKNKLDFNLSDKQMRRLLEEQPTWANQLNDETIKKHLK